MASGDHDFTAGEVLTAANVDDYLMLQAKQEYASSAARDTALSTRKREGTLTHQADANSMTIYSGSAWSTIGPLHGALTAWTPTVVQPGSVTLTNTYSRYIRIGRLIICWFNISMTGTGTASNAVVIGGLPFAAAVGSSLTVGYGNLYDSSVPNKFPCSITLDTTTTLGLRSPLTTIGSAETRLGIVTFTAALASGDLIDGHFMYEAGADA